MRCRWRDQFVEIESNSKFHNTVREIFIDDPFFRFLRCYQEVPVVDLAPDYPYPLHRYDWFIEDLGVVVELHGAQHYKMVNYGSISYEEATKRFEQQQERDQHKKAAAAEAGYDYIEISYKHSKKLTPELLKQFIL